MNVKMSKLKSFSDMPGSAFAIASVAAIVAISKNKGSRSEFGSKWYHGTTTNLFPVILEEGFRGGNDPWGETPAEFIRSFNKFERKIMKEMSIKEDDVFENDEYMEIIDEFVRSKCEENGTPLPGFVYMSKRIEETLTREDKECINSTEIVLELNVDESTLVADEDEFGSIISGLALGYEDKSKYRTEFEILNLMGDKFKKEISQLCKIIGCGSEEWESASLIAKAIYRKLGREVYSKARIYEKAATDVMPKIVGVHTRVKGDWGWKRLNETETIRLSEIIKKECKTDKYRKTMGPTLPKRFKGPVFQWEPGQ